MTSRAVDAHIPEADYQDLIADYARMRGWRVHHARPARVAGNGWRTAVSYDGAGYPDLAMARRGYVIHVEVKSQAGSLRPEQKKWLLELGAAPDFKPDPTRPACMAKPADWPAVQKLLR